MSAFDDEVAVRCRMVLAQEGQRTPSQRIADMAIAQVEAGASVSLDAGLCYVVITAAGVVRVSVHATCDRAILDLTREEVKTLDNVLRDAYLTQKLKAAERTP